MKRTNTIAGRLGALAACFAVAALLAAAAAFAISFAEPQPVYSSDVLARALHVQINSVKKA